MGVLGLHQYLNRPQLRSVTSQLEVPFTCDGTQSTRKACAGEPFYKAWKGKRYCVLHYPLSTKEQAFDAAVKKKLDAKDFNFEGVCFPEGIWFDRLEMNETANFSFAVFNNYISFSKTVFRDEVSFAHATFHGDARFDESIFTKKVSFNSAKFLKDASFHKAVFGGYADFWRCTFDGPAEFRYAQFLSTASFWPGIFNSTASFYEAYFKRANFRASEFKEKAVFNTCRFEFAEFIDTHFGGDADFFNSKFEGMTNFIHAIFNSFANFRMSEFYDEARFALATFKGETDFSHTVFKDIISFSGEYGYGGFSKDAACDFRHARFEKPDRVSFHSTRLRPHWFVNVDPRGFQFIDVKWIGNLNRKFIDLELSALKKREEREDKEANEKKAEWLENAEQYNDKLTIEFYEKEEMERQASGADPSTKQTRFNRLLSITCRELAVNAEENHRYDEASDFRFWSMEIKRREGPWARGRLSIGILHNLYRYLSGYGEEVWRALGILLGVWLLFGVLYTQVGFVRSVPTLPVAATYETDEVGSPQRPIKALAYSLEIITLQRPDPLPLTATARFAVLAERILGPIQAALLALAIRRRFMR